MATTMNIIQTSHGAVAVRESSGAGSPVLMIHGNSSAGIVFRNQFEGSIGNTYRLIAPDLPGHGASSNAIDPDRTYSMPGYAQAMAEVLNLLGVEKAAVFGWSLGGHVGLEMIDLYPGMLGLMITGTSPINWADLSNAMRPSPHLMLAVQEVFSEADIDAYSKSTCGSPYDPLLRDAVARTDGRARALMFSKAASGYGKDQSQIILGKTPPIAVVNGADEPFVNTDFLETVPFANLWEGKKHLIRNSGHAPFWDSPDRFDPIFERFLKSVS